jgi:hypothetical protein
MSIAVHSWTTSGHASIKPMQWCSPISTPESYAAQAARILAADPTPYLFLVDNLQVPGHSIFSQDVDMVLANGPDLSEYEGWYTDLFGEMNTAGIVPRKLIVDLEAPGDRSYFNLMNDLDNDQRPALMQHWYDNEAIAIRMTPAMQALAPDDFKFQGQNVQTWSEWWNEVTYLSALRVIRDIARSVFSLPNLVATNYGDSCSQSFAALDLNGFPIAQAGVTSGWSAPTLYPELGRVSEGLSKDRLYNTYLNHLNTVRAQDLTQTTIWIPFPSQRVGFTVTDSFARWMWEQFVRLLIEAGATDLIFFNPFPACTQADIDLAARVLATYVGRTFTPIAGQAKVNLDSASITMGPRTLRYSTFRGRLAGALRRLRRGR